LASRKAKRYRLAKKNDPKRRWAQTAINGARFRKTFIVAIELDDLLAECGDTCVYCGISLNYNGAASGDRRSTASLDRIDPSLGYVVGNIAVACYRCNAIKSDATPAELRQIASAVERLLS
jgi:hypothetical protein